MNILFCPFLTTCSVGAGVRGGEEEAYAKLPHPSRYKSSNFKDCTKITFPRSRKYEQTRDPVKVKKWTLGFQYFRVWRFSIKAL
jgi:hypothetical protein